MSIDHRLYMATALRRSINAMSFTPPYRYVTADTLAQALLKQKTQGQQQSQRRVAVVDVRDDDFEGGNIVGAMNVPSTTFDERVQVLATKELKDGEWRCCQEEFLTVFAGTELNGGLFWTSSPAKSPRSCSTVPCRSNEDPNQRASIQKHARQHWKRARSSR